MRKTALKSVFLAIFIALSLPTVAFAQADAIEDERTQQLLDQILLTLPDETDNPNYTLAFTDPSDSGVFVAIDGQKKMRIESPYVLPSLAVGDHKIVITFTDNEETQQTIEKIIIIVPRPPKIDPPTVADTDKISTTGTALPGSTVNIALIGGSQTYTGEAEVDQNGIWEYIFEGDFEAGVFTLVGYTARDGFASNYSESVVFKIESTETATAAETRDETFSFKFETLASGDVIRNLTNNPEFIYLVVILILFGWIIGIVLNVLTSGRKEKKSEKEFLKLLNKSKHGTEDQLKKTSNGHQARGGAFKNMISKSSIREKLDLKKKDEEKDKEIQKEENVEEKIETKEDAVPNAAVNDVDEPKESEYEAVIEDTPEETKVEDSSTEPETVDEKTDVEEEQPSEPAEQEAEETADSKKDDEEEPPVPPTDSRAQEITKEEFLQKFKNMDPDDETGKELEVKPKSKDKKSKKDKPTGGNPETTQQRNIKITLTSDSLK